MKTWAARRKQEFEAMGHIELARMFELIVKICELEEHFQAHAGRADALERLAPALDHIGPSRARRAC
jgi:hypothetical protein